MVSLTDPIPLRSVASHDLRDELGAFADRRSGMIDNAGAVAFFQNRGVDPTTFKDYQGAAEAAITRVRKMASIPWVDVSSLPTYPFIVRTERDLPNVRWFYGAQAPNWKGDFHKDGFGAGQVRIGRGVHEDVSERVRPDGSLVQWGDQDYAQYQRASTHDTLDFVVDCNLVDFSKMQNLDPDKCRLVFAPAGFVPDYIKYGALSVHASPSYPGRFGQPASPELKHLETSIDTSVLRNLMANTGSLEFYIELVTRDGQTIPINRDGVPGRNFRIDANEIAPAP